MKLEVELCCVMHCDANYTIFFVIFGDPPPPFVNFSNFLRGYTEVHKYIIDS